MVAQVIDCICSESVEVAAEKFGFHKLALLRNFSKKVGIQLQLREYQLDNRAKAAFSEEDVLNLFPVVKHLHPKVLYLVLQFVVLSSQNIILVGYFIATCVAVIEFHN